MRVQEGKSGVIIAKSDPDAALVVRKVEQDRMRSSQLRKHESNDGCMITGWDVFKASARIHTHDCTDGPCSGRS